jgi:endonuclease-8
MEGPSLVILTEETKLFIGKQVSVVSGNSKIDQQQLVNQHVLDFKSWGKHFLICFEGFTLRIHFLMFGSYRINEKKDAVPRLSLQFDNGEINLYSCAIKVIEEDLDLVYNWSADVMSDEWNPKNTRKAVKQKAGLTAKNIRMPCRKR